MAMHAQIIKESMRMFPVGGSGIGRYADRDIDLGGYLIPKGTEVAVCLHTMHMVPWNFPEPTRFSLERWLDSGKSLQAWYSGFCMSSGTPPQTTVPSAGSTAAYSALSIYLILSAS